MIVYVDLTGKIFEDETRFAWYDMVRSKFVSIAGAQIWSSWEDFERDCQLYGETSLLKRCRPLFQSKPKPIKLDSVIVQENGIIALENGYIIGRILDRFTLYDIIDLQG